MGSEVVSLPGLDLPRAAFDLCLGLEARGAMFRVTDGKLTLSGLKLTPEELVSLKAYKAHVIAMVSYKGPRVEIVSTDVSTP